MGVHLCIGKTYYSVDSNIIFAIVVVIVAVVVLAVVVVVVGIEYALVLL